MSNNKKKKKKPVTDGAAAPTKTASQLKKEQKAEAARLQQENMKKRQKYYGVAAVVALVAVIVSFASGSMYGQDIYGWLQVLCYVLMACCGFITMRAAAFEELEKKQNRMRSIGIVFMMVGLGMALSQIVMALRG